jgi:hypothetical protein
MSNNFRNVSSFDRLHRLDRFKTNNQVENILDLVNGLVLPIEDLLSKTCYPKSKQAILIIGAPRSGTTYLYQLMSSSLRVGYVSNLMARFYGSPLFGAWLQNQLISSEITELNHLESTHGVTSRIYEPHEFGYFWARHLPFTSGNHEEIDPAEFRCSLNKLETTLGQIAGIFHKPVVFKCMIASFVLEEILNNTSVFVIHLRRDFKNVVDSILKVRQERLGDVRKWWSVRPANWEELSQLDPRLQVEKQVELINSALYQARHKHPNRVIEIDYQELLSNRDSTLDYIFKRCFDYAQ